MKYVPTYSRYCMHPISSLAISYFKFRIVRVSFLGTQDFTESLQMIHTVVNPKGCGAFKLSTCMYLLDVHVEGDSRGSTQDDPCWLATSDKALFVHLPPPRLHSHSECGGDSRSGSYSARFLVLKAGGLNHSIAGSPLENYPPRKR